MRCWPPSKRPNWILDSEIVLVRSACCAVLLLTRREERSLILSCHSTWHITKLILFIIIVWLVLAAERAYVNEWRAPINKIWTFSFLSVLNHCLHVNARYTKESQFFDYNLIRLSTFHYKHFHLILVIMWCAQGEFFQLSGQIGRQWACELTPHSFPTGRLFTRNCLASYHHAYDRFHYGPYRISINDQLDDQR